MGSLVAIFFALGIGILIGGSLGQQWMFQTEQHTLSILMDKYEGQLEENQKLNQDMNKLQLMQQSVTPLLEHKRILWIRPHTLQNDLIAQMMVSVGVDWVEEEPETWLGDVHQDGDGHAVDVNGIGSQATEMQLADMIIISDPEQIDFITRMRKQIEEEHIGEPTEKATSTPQGIDHHTSVE